MKPFLKLNQISLIAGIFLTSCLGSKFLHEDEQILAKQKIEGIEGSLKDDSFVLLPQQKNTRLIGLPFTHLAQIYKLGENGVTIGPKIERKKMRLDDKVEIYSKRIQKASTPQKKEKLKVRIDRIYTNKSKKISSKEGAHQLKIIPGFNKEKAVQQEKDIVTEYDAKIDNASKEKKRIKLRAKKARKVDKKRKKINQGNQVMRWGEPLSLYSHNNARLAANDIKNYLFSKGYFKAKVAIDTTHIDSLKTYKKIGIKTRNWFSRIAGAKHRYINLTFRVDEKERYVIDSIQYEIKDPNLQKLIGENSNKSPLKKGFYAQNILSAERDHIYNLAIDNGYYEFSKQFISFQIDSTLLGQDSLIVRELISNPVGKSNHKIFQLDSIVFVAEASITETQRRSVTTFQDVTFSFGKKKYPERILGWRIPMEKNDLYSRSQTIETQRQLSFLDNFKFVNINYDTTGNKFIANIFTSPFEKFQTSSEFGLSSTLGDNQGNPGPFFNLNLKNRNAFNLLEVTNLDFNAKLQDLSPIRDDISSDFTGAYTSRQIGGELSFSFPQFVFPIGYNNHNKIGQYNPKTRLSIGVIYEDRLEEYKRLEYNGAISYSWQVLDRIKYSITPSRIRWIDSQNSVDFQTLFLDSLIENRNPYANAFRSAVVSSSSFERIQNFGDYTNGSNGGFLRTYFEFGGQFNKLLSNSLFGDELEKFNYIKTNIDIRKINRLSSKYNLAYRLNLGFAYPFGDNRGLPYDGYFYAGGSSSIRGWRPRRLGPGSYVTFIEDELTGEATGEINDQIEQPGEILIESSLELRRDLVGFMEGALFLDAGNIWRIENNTDDPEYDNAVFQFNSFVTQIALAGGAGLRFDLQFLILRLDLGVKLIDPAKDRDNRFVGRNVFNNFSDNTEINIGIGYPF